MTTVNFIKSVGFLAPPQDELDAFAAENSEDPNAAQNNLGQVIEVTFKYEKVSFGF